MNQQLAHVGPEADTSLLTVTKAKLKNGLLYAEFSEQHDAQAAPRTFTMQGTEPVHPDLLRALAHLVPHLCLFTEQLTETPDYWPDDVAPTADGDALALPAHFAAYSVTGFSLGRGQAGVTLVGQRELAGGQVLNLTSPYTAFEDEHATYAYPGQLEAAMQGVLHEVEAALRGKASATGRQLPLFTAEAPAAAPQLTAA
ncbi:hypothetical protein HHL22_11845 [Hymenobacter sp. RP-2-7]|uniref:Uncharacterized protein n=1 Tax=Hymenobacter polaris TaxID=2682546 RepID=A0A7Y0AEJ6_9BACT|nr:hypothetical protein [Hymenobacter polaris]NML65898.1 hypothetical protein [Hymenobacter polaris]